MPPMSCMCIEDRKKGSRGQKCNFPAKGGGQQGTSLRRRGATMASHEHGGGRQARRGDRDEPRSRNLRGGRRGGEFRVRRDV
eukprot:6219506-Prorocentrum_lima.AAC.1